jgi:hypothetical protein
MPLDPHTDVEARSLIDRFLRRSRTTVDNDNAVLGGQALAQSKRRRILARWIGLVGQIDRISCLCRPGLVCPRHFRLCLRAYIRWSWSLCCDRSRALRESWRLWSDCRVPIRYLSACPEFYTFSLANDFNYPPKISQPVGRTHYVWMDNYCHDARRLRRVRVDLFELIKRSIIIFRCLVMLY